MKIKRTFKVSIEIDPEGAAEWKDGKYDMDAYPNWDINYADDENRFIEVIMDELKANGEYSGITISVEEE